MVVIVCVIIVTGKRGEKKKKKIVTADIASVYYSRECVLQLLIMLCIHC
jgi:hypothetical protein